jgi:RNA polymerase sigma factor (sigma-70 family)
MSIFATTRWSVVLSARDGDGSEAGEAWDVLCRLYWYPVYAMARRDGCGPDDAADLTQEFFGRLIGKEQLRAADRERGRFRTFLRVAFRRFLINEREKAGRLKRGGDRPMVSWDAAEAEERYRWEPQDASTPERIFERRWASTLLEAALKELRRDYERAGVESVQEFEVLKANLVADRGSVPYGEIAAALGRTEGAARVAMHRLRKRYRELFRAAVADTVENEAELDEELRYIASVLADG